MLKKKAAFTIIELLISLLLISILFAIFYKTNNSYENFNIFIGYEKEKSQKLPVGKVYIYQEDKIIKYEYNTHNL